MLMDKRGIMCKGSLAILGLGCVLALPVAVAGRPLDANGWPLFPLNNAAWHPALGLTTCSAAWSILKANCSVVGATRS